MLCKHRQYSVPLFMLSLFDGLECEENGGTH